MKPNDGYCHLSGGGIYTEAENQVWEPNQKFSTLLLRKNEGFSINTGLCLSLIYMLYAVFKWTDLTYRGSYTRDHFIRAFGEFNQFNMK